MFLLRLFRADSPDRELDRRFLTAGGMIIGRGPGVDWPLDDPSRVLSRRHCELGLSGETLTVRDLSANGVWIGEPGRRMSRDCAETLRPGEPLRLSRYLLIAEPLARTDGRSPALERGPFEAFCDGAGLDASSLWEEDQEAVLRRAGEIFLEMALSLHRLMEARTADRCEREFDGTRIHAQGNNALRWTGGERLGLDLLKPPEGFVDGREAVRAATLDLAAHIRATREEARRACLTLLDALAPEALAEKPADRLLRTGRLWRRLVERRAVLRAAIAAEDSPAWRALLKGGSPRALLAKAGGGFA